jgi:hypothetical protein
MKTTKMIKALYFAFATLVISGSALAANTGFEVSTSALADQMIFAAKMLAVAGFAVGTILSCVPSKQVRST